jgi:hypothetical protein
MFTLDNITIDTGLAKKQRNTRDEFWEVVIRQKEGDRLFMSTLGPLWLLCSRNKPGSGS